MTQERSDIGLVEKSGRRFVGLIILLGLVIGAIVYAVAENILREQNNQLASLVTMNLSDAATGHVVSKDVLQLKTLVTKYGRLSGVAYAFIKDREGMVIAHSSITFSPELQNPLTSDERREGGTKMLKFQGRDVYETRGPILEGQLGTVHLGIWADALKQQVNQTRSMLIGSIALVIVAGVIVAAFLARRLVRPFRRLTDIADRISAGELDTPVRVESQNEFGELTRSLERMRASLKAAMVRLNGDAHIHRDKGGRDEHATA
jgi:two-component system cell cycle sensor histidine kinase/response regulator CckA